jgi:hypothetical protein
MTLPFHLPLHGRLPRELVIPTSDVGAFLAMATVLVGVAYLLFGLKVFRLVTTIHAILAGTIAGAYLGVLIDSMPVGMLLGAIAAGLATWVYTRWTMALAVGLSAAGAAWIIAGNLGANVIGIFFVSIAAAVAVGAPVLMYYRIIVMAYTSVAGAAMVVVGTAASIMLIRLHTLAAMPYAGGHAIVGGVCVLLLAIPAFFFQHLRYPPPTTQTPPPLPMEETQIAKRRAA